MTQPDNLFKSKLEHYAKPAPVMAWDKIESRLNNKDRGIFWMKIAASVAIVSAATFIFWPSTPESQIQLANNNSTKETPQKNTIAKQNPEEIKTDSKTQVTSSALNNSEKVQEPSSKLKTLEKNKASISKEPSQNLLAMQEEIATDPLQEIKFNAAETITQTETESSSTEFTSTTIVYSSEEANKFLKKNNAEATSTEKKSSGIQKLLTLAADIKNNETGFGELREMKNEILALNFREDKKGVNK